MAPVCAKCDWRRLSLRWVPCRAARRMRSATRCDATHHAVMPAGVRRYVLGANGGKSGDIGWMTQFCAGMACLCSTISHVPPDGMVLLHTAQSNRAPQLHISSRDTPVYARDALWCALSTHALQFAVTCSSSTHAPDRPGVRSRRQPLSSHARTCGDTLAVLGRACYAGEGRRSSTAHVRCCSRRLRTNSTLKLCHTDT